MTDREGLRHELLNQQLWSSDDVAEYLALSGIEPTKARDEGFPQPIHEEGRTWWVKDDVVVWCQHAGGRLS
jgi:hypothetical protein